MTQHSITCMHTYYASPCFSKNEQPWKRALPMRHCCSAEFAFAIRPWWTSSTYRIAALVFLEAAGTTTPPRSVFPSTSLLVIQVYLKHSQTLLVSHLTHLHDTVLELSQAAGPHRSYLHSDHSAACWTRWKHVQVQTAQDRQSITEFCFEWGWGFPASRLGQSGRLRVSRSQLRKFLFCTGFERAQQIHGPTSLQLQAKGKGTKTSWVRRDVLRDYVAQPFSFNFWTKNWKKGLATVCIHYSNNPVLEYLRIG